MFRAAWTVAALLLAWPAIARPAQQAAETRLPNPAALFCEQSGGRYRTVEEAGGARGICILADGREVDAWEYFRERQSALPSCLEKADCLCGRPAGSRFGKSLLLPHYA